MNLKQLEKAINVISSGRRRSGKPASIWLLKQRALSIKAVRAKLGRVLYISKIISEKGVRSYGPAQLQADGTYAPAQ